MSILRTRLVTVPDEDQQLSKLLATSPRPALQDFAAGLIRECLVSDPPMATRLQFPLTLDALAQLIQAGRATEAYVYQLN